MQETGDWISGDTGRNLFLSTGLSLTSNGIYLIKQDQWKSNNISVCVRAKWIKIISKYIHT